MPADPTPAVLGDLAPSGRMRAGINVGNAVLAQWDASIGAPQGIAVDLARELGRCVSVAVDLVTFDAAGQLFEAAKAGTVDIAFLAVDPQRGAALAFTPPYLHIEGTYLVRTDSSLTDIDEVDRAGARVVVGAGGAHEMFLTRTLKRALLLREPTGQQALERFVREPLDAVAGVRQTLTAFANRHPGLRVMDGRFMLTEQAIAIEAQRVAGANYLAAFVEQQKRNGFVAFSLERSGHAATIAP